MSNETDARPCGTCGTSNRTGMIFCRTCGNQVATMVPTDGQPVAPRAADPAAETVLRDGIGAPRRDSTLETVRGGQASPHAPVVAAPPVASGRPGRAALFAALVALIVVGGGIGVAVALVGGGDGPAVADPPVTTSAPVTSDGAGLDEIGDGGESVDPEGDHAGGAGGAGSDKSSGEGSEKGSGNGPVKQATKISYPPVPVPVRNLPDCDGQFILALSSWNDAARSTTTSGSKEADDSGKLLRNVPASILDKAKLLANEKSCAGLGGPARGTTFQTYVGPFKSSLAACDFRQYAGPLSRLRKLTRGARQSACFCQEDRTYSPRLYNGQPEVNGLPVNEAVIGEVALALHYFYADVPSVDENVGLGGRFTGIAEALRNLPGGDRTPNLSDANWYAIKLKAC